MVSSCTEEWHSARRRLLTASDFAAACGLNQYSSRQKLFRLKTGREVFEGNERTQYGNDNEATAIARYEAITGSLVSPGMFCTNPLYQNLGATPDGYIDDERLLEVKCPVNGLYKEIPVYYLAQMVGQMEIADVDVCDFLAWTPEESKLWEVSRSKAAWEVMLPFLESMVNYIRSDIEPPTFKKGEKLDPDEFRKLIEVVEAT